MNNEINKRIIAYRKLACLTQTQTAEKLGMKCSTYSQMERKGNIRAEIIEKLAEIFGVDPCLIIFGEDFNSPVAPIVAEKPAFLPEASTNVGVIQQPITTTSLPPLPKTNIDDLTPKEQNIIKILRKLSKADKADVYNFIESKL